MHPNIANFVSHYIYEDLLKSERKSAEQVQMITDQLPFSNESVIHFDLTGIYCPTGKNSDNSRFNIFSALLAFYCALDCEKRGEQKENLFLLQIIDFGQIS